MQQVNTLLSISKKPNVDDVMQHSFPWHQLFCYLEKQGNGSPIDILGFLRQRVFKCDDIVFNPLSDEEKKPLVSIMKSDMDNLSDELFSELGKKVRFVSIMQLGENYA